MKAEEELQFEKFVSNFWIHIQFSSKFIVHSTLRYDDDDDENGIKIIFFLNETRYCTKSN